MRERQRGASKNVNGKGLEILRWAAQRDEGELPPVAEGCASHPRGPIVSGSRRFNKWMMVIRGETDLFIESGCTQLVGIRWVKVKVNSTNSWGSSKGLPCVGVTASAPRIKMNLLGYSMRLYPRNEEAVDFVRAAGTSATWCSPNQVRVSNSCLQKACCNIGYNVDKRQPANLLGLVQ